MVDHWVERRVVMMVAQWEYAMVGTLAESKVGQMDS
jgi:hypothetical protein